MSFEVEIERFELAKCETFWSMLRRWLAKLLRKEVPSERSIL